VLDTPEVSNRTKARFKSRVPSDLMIVIGVVHLLIGLFCIYVFCEVLYHTVAPVAREIDQFPILFFVSRFLLQSLPLLIGVVLCIGGFGLIRHKIRGWKYSLGASTFVILLPVLKIGLNLFLPQLNWSMGNLFSLLFLLVFGASFVFSISKIIRDFYQPKTKDYLFAGIITAILSLNFLLTPLLLLGF